MPTNNTVLTFNRLDLPPDIRIGYAVVKAALSRKREALVAAERWRADLAARQESNRHDIVRRLVQEERRPSAAGGDGDGDNGPHTSPLAISADARDRLQRLLESEAGQADASDGSDSVSLTEMARDWAQRRPRMPVERPCVTSRPCPFSWKPDVIEFKDFQVGWTYHRRVSIVNLSATRCSCRYIGLFEVNYYQLNHPMVEMLRVRFSPPGFLGTGLAARLELEFTPRLLSDGSCLVRFQAPNGEFHVPVRFVAQRCEPRLERASLEFGELVLGARVRRSVTLRNSGSKGCRFTIRAVGGSAASSTPLGDREGGEASTSALGGEESSSSGSQEPEPTPSVGVQKPMPVPSGGDRVPSHGDEKPALGPSPSGEETAPADPSPGDQEPAPTPHCDDEPASTPSPSGVTSQEAASQSATGQSNDNGSDADRASERGVDSGGGDSDSRGSQSVLQSAAAVVGSILQQLFDRLPIIDFDGGLGICGSGEGELPAGGRARLHLGCVADLEGTWRQQFVVEFDDPTCEPIPLAASYSGHVFPITVRNPHITLDICLCGLTYWDNFEIINTGKVASRVQTLVPEDIKPFVEIQGATALVQADSAFKVKIYFKPKRSLLTPPHRFFDPATHVLDFPVAFHVEGRSIRGSVQAAVSSDRVWVHPERLELGRVTLLESVRRRVQLTNGGLAAQLCQFTGLPDSASVQPGNGSAVLLPGETMPLDVIFSPSVVGQHQFTLVVETLDGGRATVSCRGFATTPALSLSVTSIKMAGAPIQGTMTAAVFVQCPKAPLAEEKHFASGGSFEFQPPDDIPLCIHPLVGFVPYKQSRRVEVRLTPQLERSELAVTAALLQYERLELEQTRRLEEEAQLAKNKRKARARKKSMSPKRQTILCPEPSTVKTGSAIYQEAEQLQQRNYEPVTRRYVIPCCVRHGDLEQKGSGAPEVLYLEVVCSTAAPQLLAVSPRCLEFGARVLGAPAYLPLELENTAAEPVRVRADALDPHGPFRLVDPLGEVAPGQRRAVRVSYCPVRLNQELEFWSLHGGNTTLRYGLSGRGVKAEFSFVPEDGVLTLGKAKLGGSVKKQIVVCPLTAASVLCLSC
ncbi:cilia- and flagella-associated protein 74-like [Pollicipes pollicipes]|uniref:cilia- and flagella-associated protein 74-like n=1 Tax=Pollicipes pollicipes TaxID=41117 RepID=UPI001884B346|nr:cilia- and flagella-associated protein 74-like [Pollicipes pollicipes]